MTKKILFAVFLLIAIPLVVALFTPDSYQVERQVEINKSKREVFSYVKLLKNQDYFSKWAQIDPNMSKTYRGIDGEVGFVSRWESSHPDVGTGEQEILAIVDGERIDYELRFIEPISAVSPAYMVFIDTDANTSQVKWGFRGDMPYPMNIMMWFIDFEDVIGTDLQIGLDNLKVILEAQ